jgi:HEAT repeat protein
MINSRRGRILLRVVEMSSKRLFIALLVLAIGCQQGSIGEQQPEAASGTAAAETKLSTQLQVNKDALLNEGSSEQMRVNAASVILVSEEPSARAILIDTLRQSENEAAQAAVCKALSLAVGKKEQIKDKQDFLDSLIDILRTKTDGVAKQAAEALLIFEYSRISPELEKMASDPATPVGARLNAIYALKLRPNVQATIKLLNLLDDSDQQVAEAAAAALQSQGIPASKDAQTRQQIIDGLERKGRDEFLRDWVVHREVQMRKLEAEVALWQKLYLGALDEIYNSKSNDEAKGKFLTEQLGSTQTVAKLWALEKASQWRKGTGAKPKLSAELEPILVNLISDADRNVRLRTAKLLSLMVEVNSAQRLADQLKVEKDDEVKMELFVALGGACHYAYLPDSGIKVPGEIRKQTLELAGEYLIEGQAQKAQKGAEVIRKLLEQDQLESAEAEKYLGLIAQTYEQQKAKADGILCGELLGAMAGLCGPRSAHKTEAAKTFERLFEEALSDDVDLVREAAVEGLINIDKTKALGKLRGNFANDDSAKIRQRVIELAGEVGGKDDLAWLAERLGSAESELAWQTMLRIFKAVEASVLDEWIGRFSSQDMKVRLSDEQMVSLLETAERKASGEKNSQMLKNVRNKLAELYIKGSKFEQAAKCLGMLREAADSPEEEEAILGRLLGVYLRWPNLDAAKGLIANRLLEADLDPNSVIVQSIENYLTVAAGGADPNAVIEVLMQVETPQARPMWAERMRDWQHRLRQDKDPNEPKNRGD